MSLLQVKKDFEQYFFDNYLETEVHWSGEQFNIDENNEWVFFEYLGSAVEDNGFDSSEYMHKGQLYLCVVADTRFRVMEIADICLELFKGKKIGNGFVRQITVEGQGMIQDRNKSYVDIVMNISMV